MTRFRLLTIASVALPLCGCQSPSPTPNEAVTRGQMPPDYAIHVSGPGPLPPGAVASAPWIADTTGSGQCMMVPLPGSMTLPSGDYLNQPPQYFPPDPAFPLQRELDAMPPPLATPTVKVPPKVAPPTPEQVGAVPDAAIKFLQTGAFDPNIVAAGVALPVPGAVPPPTNVAPGNPLVGTTWTRQLSGVKLIATFSKDRLELATPAGQGNVHVRLRANCAYGPNGLVYGVVTTVQSQSEQDNANLARYVAAAGSPFCFRVRLDGDAITVSDLRAEALGKDFITECPLAAQLLLGTYARPQADALPLPIPSDDRLPPAQVPPFPPLSKPSPVISPPMYVPEPGDRLPPTPVAPLPPPAVRERSSLDTVLEMAHTFAAENPAVVRAVAAEAGRAAGSWLGRKVEQPRAGEMIGLMLGAAAADRLIGTKPTPPPAPATVAQSLEPTDIEALAFWLGAPRPKR